MYLQFAFSEYVSIGEHRFTPAAVFLFLWTRLGGKGLLPVRSSNIGENILLLIYSSEHGASKHHRTWEQKSHRIKSLKFSSCLSYNVFPLWCPLQGWFVTIDRTHSLPTFVGMRCEKTNFVHLIFCLLQPKSILTFL